MNILSDLNKTKLRDQAARAANVLKTSPFSQKDEIKLGFVFDDAIATVVLKSVLVRTLTYDELAEHLYNALLAQIADR